MSAAWLSGPATVGCFQACPDEQELPEGTPHVERTEDGCCEGPLRICTSACCPARPSLPANATLPEAPMRLIGFVAADPPQPDGTRLGSDIFQPPRA